MFLYETPAISGSVAIHAVQLRHTPPPPCPSTRAPEISPTRHSPLPFTVVQMNNPSSQSQEGRTRQGTLSNIITHRIMAQKKPVRVVVGETTFFSEDLLSLTFTTITCQHADIVWDHFYTCGDFLIQCKMPAFPLWTDFPNLYIEMLACPVWLYVAFSTM